MVDRNIKLLYWFNFFSDFRLYAGIAILYFTHVTGSYALGMSIFSITFIAAALAEVPTGIFSDRIGRKKTVIIGSITGTLAVLLYGIGGTFWILAIGAVVDGISRSFFSGNNEALLYDSLAQEGKEDRYHEFYGKVNSAFQIALAIASGMGGFIAILSFQLVMFISLVPQIIALIISFLFVEPKHFKKESTNIFIHLKEAIYQFKINYKLKFLSLSQIFGYALGESGFQFRAAFVNTLWPVWAVGLSSTASFVGGAIGFHFSGKIIDKLGALKVWICEEILSKIINLFSLIFPTIFSPALMSLTSLGFGPSTVAGGSLLQKEFTDKQRATMGSLNSFAGSILFGIISFVLGSFADSLGPRNALLILSLCGFAPIYFLWKVIKRSKIN